MFNSSDKDKDKSINKIETLIGDGCTVIGSLKGEDLLKIDGYFEGNIIWQDDIIIGATGYCKGDISCKSAYISGKVEGNICCEGILAVESYGKVFGDVNVKNIIIRDGGIFQGKCTVLTPEEITTIE
ncbi:Polymer-forming cytoskeletal [Clostridium liquoris]|jgi:cytoskeletal protein CcmA (bactofilin family)|uniref:Polymer-forming cytoskeletal n=1 Tax=Clostridium liquoris TaxID=1289519 RepID=A0A2T0B5F2_9CLOT|nr:polymer-forming cytoskeletal protein [Clostridium liquoris]PRR79105.1 Polymer-forming cytoskeletal [Clostridium liquoris]